MVSIKRVMACSACGSGDLKWASGGADAYLDAIGNTNSGLFECGACGRQVPAIEFRTEKDRERFYKLVHHIAEGKKPAGGRKKVRKAVKPAKKKARR